MSAAMKAAKAGGRHVMFTLGDSTFAIPMSKVQEIQAAPRIASIPRGEAWLAGVIGLRGSIVSVVDVRGALGCAGARSAAPRLIIVATPAFRAALLADAVLGIAAIDPEEIAEPDPQTAGSSPHITGLHSRAGEFVTLLDPDALLAREEFLLYQ